MTPEAFLDLIISERDSKQYRCTGCGGTFSGEPAGYPLFAGINCEKCWAKHQEKVEEERKSGKTCRLCGQPRSLCCC